MRCFVGIELDPRARDALVRAGERVRKADPSWAGEKWVRAENLHVTVAFLGDVPEDVAGDLADSIGARLADTAAFSLPFGRLRAVPNARRASMMWAVYLDPDGRGAALEHAVAGGCRPFGVTLEDRAFRAHVTLVRARRPRHVGAEATATFDASAEAVPPFLSVPSATLFSSTLTKAGPVYHSIVNWTFRPTDACE